MCSDTKANEWTMRNSSKSTPTRCRKMHGAIARRKSWKRFQCRSMVIQTRKESARRMSRDKPHKANVHAPLNALDERVQQEVEQLESDSIAPFPVLQLLQ